MTSRTTLRVMSGIALVAGLGFCAQASAQPAEAKGKDKAAQAGKPGAKSIKAIKAKREAAKAGGAKPDGAEKEKPEAAEGGENTAEAAKAGGLKGDDPAAADSAKSGPGDKDQGKARGGKRPSSGGAKKSYRKAMKMVADKLAGRLEEDLSDEEKEALKDARKALAAARKEIRRAHLGDGKLSKAEREAFVAKLKELNEARKADRKERAEKERDGLKKSLGEAKLSPAISAELRHHAWRIARLNRLFELAKAGDKEKALERIEGLIEKENARHEKHLTHLKEGKGDKDHQGKSDDTHGKADEAKTKAEEKKEAK